MVRNRLYPFVTLPPPPQSTLPLFPCSPDNSNLVAAGCANHRIVLYDLRRATEPLRTLTGPQRAVSYVRFLSGKRLVTASTDSVVR